MSWTLIQDTSTNSNMLGHIMNHFYVYCYLDPRYPGEFKFNSEITFDFKPFYIGKGQGKRMFDHLRRKDFLWRDKLAAIRSEGLEPLVRHVVCNLTEKAALDLEGTLIDFFGKKVDHTGCLVNIASRGNALSGNLNGMYGKTHTEDARKIISNARKGVKLSNEHKAKIDPTGRTHSEETKRKISESQIGKIVPPEVGANISKAKRGKPLSEAHRQACREGHARRRAKLEEERKRQQAELESNDL